MGSVAGVGSWVAQVWSHHAAMICCGWFGIGLVFVYLTNYAFPNPLWTWRFREINGEDHVGPVLESAMLLLVIAFAFVTGGLCFPEAAQIIVERYLVGWPGLAVVLVDFTLVAGFCFWVTPNSLDAEYRAGDLQRQYPKFATLSEWEWQWTLRVVRTRTEVAYVFLCFISSITLVAGLAFLVGGVTREVRLRGDETKTLKAAAEQVTSRVGRSPVLEPRVVLGAERATLAYSVFVEHTLPAYEKYLGVIAILLGIGLWFVGTGYQKVYTESAVGVMKWFAFFIAFVVLPFVLVSGYAQVVKAARTVNSALTLVADRALDETSREPASGAASVGLVESRTAWFQALGDIRSRFDEQVNSTGFFTRMATSWGGAWIALWFVLSVVFKRQQNMLALLVPTLPPRARKVGRAMFPLLIRPSDETADVDSDAR